MSSRFDEIACVKNSGAETLTTDLHDTQTHTYINAYTHHPKIFIKRTYTICVPPPFMSPFLILWQHCHFLSMFHALFPLYFGPYGRLYLEFTSTWLDILSTLKDCQSPATFTNTSPMHSSRILPFLLLGFSSYGIVSRLSSPFTSNWHCPSYGKCLVTTEKRIAWKVLSHMPHALQLSETTRRLHSKLRMSHSLGSWQAA